MSEHQAWAEREIRELVRCGVNLIDAQRTVNSVLKQLPPGADPATWIPPITDEPVLISEADIQDARVTWYERAPAKYKRLLDARPIDG